MDERSSLPPAGGPRRRWTSIRWRLALAVAGASLITLVVVGVVFYVFVGSYVVDRQKSEILGQAVLMADQLDSLGGVAAGSSGAQVLSPLLKNELKALPSNAGIVVYEGARVVDRAGAAPLRAARLRVAAEAIGGTSPAVKVVAATVGATSASKPVLVAAAHFQRSTGQQGLVVVTLSVADAYAARQGLVRVLLLSGAIALAAAILMGLGLGTWLCRPLSRLSVAARRMARGEYDQPVGGSYPGEVRELAVSLETMRLEVRRSEESLRTFVASAAHELRTPLTSIQGFSQALLDGTADTPEQRQRSEAAIYRESSRLRRLIDALLTLSRYDSREFSPTLTSVDVGAIVQEEAERLVQAGFAGPGRIKVVVAGETSLVTDAGLVRQIVGNLLRNAAQYGEGDPIEVSLRVENFELVLQVANGGPPLPADERGRIFERFFRGRVGRTTEGFGLGLSLVREMCEVLGGRIDLVGGGPKTVFRVALPLRPPAVLKTGE